MNTVRWLAVAPTSPVSRTLVHFFPFSTAVTAPYPCQCRLTVFGAGLETREVLLDGARLGQPDGVRLEDAFPELQHAGGDTALPGLEITLETTQQRADIRGSSCIVEILSSAGGRITRYRPVPLERCTDRRIGIPVVRDALQSTVLFLTNASPEAYAPVLRRVGTDGELAPGDIPAHTLPPGRTVEIGMPEGLLSAAGAMECSWGLLRSVALYLDAPPAVAAFLGQRDPATGALLSVRAL